MYMYIYIHLQYRYILHMIYNHFVRQSALQSEFGVYIFVLVCVSNEFRFNMKQPVLEVFSCASCQRLTTYGWVCAVAKKKNNIPLI